MSPSYITPAATLDAMQPIRTAEAEKERRHREQCEAAGIGYYSGIWTVFGGVAGDFYTRIVKPYFAKEKEHAKAMGEDPWLVQARHDRLLDKWSVTLARFNAKSILRAVVRDSRNDAWPPTPERDDDLCDVCE